MVPGMSARLKVRLLYQRGYQVRSGAMGWRVGYRPWKASPSASIMAQRVRRFIHLERLHERGSNRTGRHRPMRSLQSAYHL
jgi:hypothetical protein